VAEAAFVEMGPVERAVVVAACCHGRGEESAGCVESLVDSIAVALAGDLLDKYGRQTLGSQLAVDGQEVDLDGVHFALADLERGWYA
jgi:hypothetical protein